MLKITVPPAELFDRRTRQFINSDGGVLVLEHSLLSISKWEAKTHKPFISTNKTVEETIEYIKCMTINNNVNPNIYMGINDEIIDEVNAYVNDPMTATTIAKKLGPTKSNQFVTSELVYYWMIAQGIPMECEKWHFNRLITLIKVCNEENSRNSKTNKNKSKRPTSDELKTRAELNAARKKALNSRG